jgi:hypothetical protein
MTDLDGEKAMLLVIACMATLAGLLAYLDRVRGQWLAVAMKCVLPRAAEIDVRILHFQTFVLVGGFLLYAAHPILAGKDGLLPPMPMRLYVAAVTTFIVAVCGGAVTATAIQAAVEWLRSRIDGVNNDAGPTAMISSLRQLVDKNEAGLAATKTAALHLRDLINRLTPQLAPRHDAILKAYLQMVTVLQGWSGNGSGQGHMPGGANLCLSVDTGMTNLSNAASFFLQDLQRDWTRKFGRVRLTESASEAVYLSGLRGRSEGSRLRLDVAIATSVQHALETLQGNHRQMEIPSPTGDAVVTTVVSLYPRCIRLMHSTPQALVYAAKALPERSPFEGPESTGIINLWVDSALLPHMRVRDWALNQLRAPWQPYFDEPVWGGAALIDLMREAAGEWALAAVTDGDLLRIAAAYENPLATPAELEHLALGVKLFMSGYSDEPIVDPQTCKRHMLSLVPTMLMALHCRRAYCFDWICALVKAARGNGEHEDMIQKRIATPVA